MSYILEALKKAQAERQLGNAPTIHAPAPSYTLAASRASRRPLVIGAAAAVLAAGLGALVWLGRSAPAPAPARAPAQVAQAPAPTPVPMPAPAPAVAQPAPVALPEASAPAQLAKPQALPSVAGTRERAPEPRPEPRPEPGQVKESRPAKVSESMPAREPQADTARPVVMAAPAAEDNVGPLQSLPEAVQREVPKVSFGGYIYSPNPAERLLLVDKMLRREGEEVAPGLVLERLLPRAAIMNFRGYRYRVAY